MMLINQAPTACDSYHAHTESGLASGQCALILGFIERSGGSWSIGELADALSMQKSTVSARINELLNETGELVAKPRRKDRVSGVKVRPVGLPPKQLDLLQ